MYEQRLQKQIIKNACDKRVLIIRIKITNEEIIKTNPINNKYIQSNKNIITIDLPFNVTILQSKK